MWWHVVYQRPQACPQAMACGGMLCIKDLRLVLRPWHVVACCVSRTSGLLPSGHGMWWHAVYQGPQACCPKAMACGGMLCIKDLRLVVLRP